MKRIFLTLCLILLLTSCGISEDEFDNFLQVNDVTSYNITTTLLDLELDTENDKLYVKGEIIYVNDVMDYEELYLMFYPNAYSATGEENNVVISKLLVNDIAYTPTFSGEDNTTVLIDNDEIYLKDDNIHIEFEYYFTYWDIDRIVAEDNYYVTMFFYPVIAIYDETGWNNDPYTFSGETYYNNVGDYLVTIDVPSDYLIASSGEEVSSQITSSRKTSNYEIKSARDFSFSASNKYFLYTDDSNGIDFEIYSLNELTETEEEDSFRYLRDSFRIFEDYVGEYYYDHFTLEYGSIYGMESSGVIYCSSNINETTVVHEVIHQWFYSMIGNNQSDYSFIDESLTTFTTGIYYYDLYGRNGADGYFEFRNSQKESLETHWINTLGSNMLRRVDNYENEYAYIIYYHGPTLFLYYLDEYLEGDFTVLKSFLNEYYNQYNGKIVTLDEFLFLLEEETGVEETTEWFMMMLDEIQDMDNRPE